MTPEEQLAKIQSSTFYTDLKNKAQAIMAAMQSAGFSVSGDSWVTTAVDDVPVSFQIRDADLFLHVGQNDDGSPIYEWRAPKAWVV